MMGFGPVDPEADEPLFHAPWERRVLGFTVALTLAVALLLSYAPTLAREGTLGGWLAAGASRMSGNLRRQRLQRGLVVALIAVSVVLLSGAGLLTRTVRSPTVSSTAEAGMASA